MQLKVVAVVAVALTVLTGCTSFSEQPEESAPIAQESLDFMIAVIDELGPVPTGPVYTAEEEEQARIQRAEAEWSQVLARFPDAERPALEFERYITSPADSSTARMACLDELGFEAAPGHSSDGDVSGFEIVIVPGQEQATMIASWQCAMRFPARPSPPLTVEQLGYLYDYFVGFQVPCLEAEGHNQLPPPSRQSFIEEWPQQGWWPRPTIEPLDSSEWDRLEALCPAVPRGLR